MEALPISAPNPAPNQPPLPPHQEGWEQLVGPLTGTAVICLDDGGPVIVALAQRCARVCVVSAQARPAWNTWSHVEVIAQDSLGTMLAREGASFDGLVLSDLPGQSQESYAGGMEALLLQTRPLLREGAFVLLAAPNRWGLNRERIRRVFRGTHAWSSRALVQQMRRAGAQGATIHPVLIDEQARISEVIAPTGYRATKNVGLLRESIKQWLWGSRSARWFAPGLMCIAWIGAPRTRLIDAVAQKLPHTAAAPRWTQYLVLLSGKVIATFVDPCRQEAPRVVVMTRDALAIDRRAREAETLRHLATTLPAPLAALLPRVLDRFSLDGNECFVLQHIPGVTADAVVPGLDRVTLASLDFLLSLHRVTATRRVMDEDEWSRVLQPMFDSAVARNGVVATELRALEKCIRDRVVGQVWTAACSHGDFKIENVMYDPTSFHLTGVIDWEHALPDGLPYIDLAYLFTYNRMLQGQPWLLAAQALLSGHITPQEKSLEARYWQALDAPERLVAVLRALVIVHHIGVRWHGEWAGQVKAALTALLQSCIALVEQTPLPPSPAAGMPPPSRRPVADRHVA
ncbi:MAG: phosphotransferase [Rhizobacter sp.]